MVESTAAATFVTQWEVYPFAVPEGVESVDKAQVVGTIKQAVHCECFEPEHMG